jgi:hypothetical protein
MEVENAVLRKSSFPPQPKVASLEHVTVLLTNRVVQSNCCPYVYLGLIPGGQEDMGISAFVLALP